MTRVVGPDERDRKIEGFTRDYQRINGFPSRLIDIYVDRECTTLADIRVYDPQQPNSVGALIEDSQLRIDPASFIPRFWYPHGVTRLWGQVNKGPLVLLDAALGLRTGLFATEHNGFPTGVLQAEVEHLATDYLHGIRIAVIEIGWDAWEPAEGDYNEEYIAEKTSAIRAYRNAGYRVGVVGGLHYAPEWLKAKPGAQHVDQWGNQSGGANFQWSQTVRDSAAGYIQQIVDACGDVEFHRIGLSRAGETLYPEAVNNNAFAPGQRQNNWWAFDTAAQAESPMPGWVPGASTYLGQPVTEADARAWYDWYFGALVYAHAWEIQAYRDAGWTGSLQIVTPGVGCLPAEHNARLEQRLAPMAGDDYFVMNTGAVWWRFYDELPDLTGCGMNASSVYDNSGNPRGNVTQPGDDQVPYNSAEIYDWSATRLLSSIARRHGIRPLMGENPGQTTTDTAKKAFATAAGCGLDALLWAFDRQLYDDDYASIADLTRLIFLHSPQTEE